MSDFHTIYKASLSDARNQSREKVRRSLSCYNALSNKDSEYAKVVKALHDLHSAAYEVYNNAPDELQ